MSDGGDGEYIRVTCYIIARTADAVMVRGARGGEGWIPISVMHGASAIALRGLIAGSTISLKIREWKVRALGLK